MGNIIVSQFITLDGIIEDATGEEGFDRGGWVGHVPEVATLNQAKLDEARDASALLLGRRTYEFFAERWPGRTGDLADQLNGLPKFVVSSTLTAAEWDNTTVLGVRDVAELRERVDGPIFVYGSFDLTAMLIEHDLIDELRLTVFPVILGAGRRLFGDTLRQHPLRISDCRTFGEGLALLTYRRLTTRKETVRRADRSPAGSVATAAAR